jgi:hypothetical protein
MEAICSSHMLIDFHRLHSVTSQKTELIFAAVSSSNPVKISCINNVLVFTAMGVPIVIWLMVIPCSILRGRCHNMQYHIRRKVSCFQTHHCLFIIHTITSCGQLKMNALSSHRRMFVCVTLTPPFLFVRTKKRCNTSRSGADFFPFQYWYMSVDRFAVLLLHLILPLKVSVFVSRQD